MSNQSAYDRSVSSDGISTTFLSNGFTGRGDIERNRWVNDALLDSDGDPILDSNGDPIIGSVLYEAGYLIMKTFMEDFSFDGDSQLLDEGLVLYLPLEILMSGSGDLQPGLAVKTPIKATLTGESYMDELSDFVYQNLIFTLSGKGDIERNRWVNDALLDSDGDPILDSDNNLIIGSILYEAGYLIMKTFMEDSSFDGDSQLLLDEKLNLYLESLMSGSSDFSLRRLGALNETVLELDGINLKPGEEVTIDTDLLSVFFGDTEDVSSVTTDSVFFELSPGENDIVINTDTGESMTVTAIWQNRWL